MEYFEFFASQSELIQLMGKKKEKKNKKEKPRGENERMKEKKEVGR
jgi:hypothetical protein